MRQEGGCSLPWPRPPVRKVCLPAAAHKRSRIAWAPTYRPGDSALAAPAPEPALPGSGRRRHRALPLAPELLELVLEVLQLRLGGVLESGERVPGLVGAPDELVQLEVKRRCIPVLGGLDE